MGKTHDDDEVEIDLRELFYALKKHILIIFAALLAGAVIAGAATKIFITPVYSATSTMLVLTKETTLSSLADLQIGSQLTKDYNILITSRTVLQDVVDELNLDMSYKALKGCITVDNPTDTRILSIIATSTDPEMAKKIADTLAKTSSDFIGDLKRGKLIKFARVCINIITKADITTLTTKFENIPAVQEKYDVAVCFHIHMPLLLKYTQKNSCFVQQP